MSKKALYLLGIFLTIVLGSILYYVLCTENCMFVSKDSIKSETTIIQPIDNSTKRPFSLFDNSGSLDININESFNFKSSSFVVLEPLSNKVYEGINEIRNYMSADTLKILNITGLFTTQEENNSAFPSLGIARANAIKNYFISTGINSKRIDVNGEIDYDILPDNSGIYYGPLKLEMSKVDDNYQSNYDSILALGAEIKEKPIVLYFETASSTIVLTSEQQLKFANISRYIDKVDDATIHIIGHTDNTGDSNSNEKLGQKRADFIKRYLMGNAILESNIVTSSQGQNSPIADNATEEGRRQNRRVVITITN